LVFYLVLAESLPQDSARTKGQVVKEIILKGKETKVDISELTAGVNYVKMGWVVKKMVKV
jgi:hypothetical protein